MASFHSVGRRAEPRFVLFDTLEPIFGPDPGLLRLATAARTVLSAATAFTILLLLTQGASRPAIAAIALGFMMAIMSNVAVRDPQPAAQARTLALLPVPALAATALAAFLARWPPISEVVFVLVVSIAALARAMGPRGMAVATVTFIAYFIGEIMHAPLSTMPLLAMGIGIGIAASALMRFLVLPQRPARVLIHIERHLRRRVARILVEAARMLEATTAGAHRAHRMHLELGRLNDAFQTAEDQMGQLGEDADARRLSDLFFAVELRAERVIRIVDRLPLADPAAAVRTLSRFAEDLRAGTPPGSPSQHPAARTNGPLERALQELDAASVRLRQSMSALDGPRATGPGAPR